MNKDFNENIYLFISHLLPFLSSVLLIICSYIPFDFFALNCIKVSFGAICTYFWLQHRPDLFNLWSVFWLGVFDDVITASPFGINMFEYLLLFVLVNNTSRLFNAKPFVVLWCGFALLDLICYLAKWLLVSVYYSQFLPLPELMVSYLITVSVYPIISLFLAFVQNNLIQEENI